MVSTIKDSSSWHHMESDKEFQALETRVPGTEEMGVPIVQRQAFRGLAIG
jgi:hypothetical protein